MSYIQTDADRCRQIQLQTANEGITVQSKMHMSRLESEVVT